MQNNRIARVLQAMQAQGMTQMIVSDPQSIDYLTGVYVEPFERLFALYLRADGRHIFFLNTGWRPARRSALIKPGPRGSCCR